MAGNPMKIDEHKTAEKRERILNEEPYPSMRDKNEGTSRV